MQKLKNYVFCYVIATCLCQIAMPQLFAQNITTNGLTVTLLKDTVTQTGNAYSFNVVTIGNTSNKIQEFSIQVTAPQNWQVLFDNRKVYSLKPSQTVQVPVRVAAGSGSTSGLAQVIALKIESPGMSNGAEFRYFAKVADNSKWKAYLVTPDLRLSRESKETLFQLGLVNQGNVTQHLSISFNTSLDLTVPKRNNTVDLAPGKDTVFTVGIISNLRYLEEFKPQDIMVQISNSEKELKLLPQKVYSFGTVFRANPSSWYNMPLSLELVGQNLSSLDKSYFLNGLGSIDLGNHRSLSFNYRSDNFGMENSGSSRYSNLNYSSENWLVSIGNQMEFNNFLLDGIGLRVNYHRNHGYGFDVMAVNSRIGDSRQLSFSQNYIVDDNQEIRNRSFVNLDYLRGVDSYTNVTEYEVRFGGNNNLVLEAGTGREKLNYLKSPVYTSGSTLGLKYDFIDRNFFFRTYNQMSSGDFPGNNKGLLISSSELRFTLKKFYTGLVLDHSQRSKSSIDTLRNQLNANLHSTEAGIRSGANFKRGYVNWTLSEVNLRQDSMNSPRVQSAKLNFNSSLPFSEKTGFMVSGNLYKSFVRTLDTDKSFYSFNVYGTFQTPVFGLTARYDYGPAYFFDYVNYAKQSLFVKRYQLSPYLEKNFFKSVLYGRVQLDYQAESGYNMHKSVMLRGDLSVNLNKQGLVLRVFGTRSLSKAVFNQDYLSVSVRKSINMPLLGIKKFKSLKVVLFKDNNNNDVYDLGDEPVEKANIQIGNQFFMTNNRGEVNYRNVPAGKYKIDLGQIKSLRGWMPKNGFEQEVKLDKDETYYMAFKRGKSIAGRINVVKDAYSNLPFTPANIRITAIGTHGNVISTLSDEEGAFFINLPEDTYIVQINTEVFNDTFRVLKAAFNADLTSKDSEELTFEIREKKRQINIREQDLSKRKK